MTTTVPWSELVTAALLGAQRRTPPGGDVTALLDAAAVRTVQRRAGAPPLAARPAPAPAPEDDRPPLPEAAERRLRSLLSQRSGGRGDEGGRRGGGTPDLGELLPQWLAAANRRGYRAPSALLPALLEAARGRTDLRPEALTFAGPRALWLARLNPDWKFALRDNPAPHLAARAATSPRTAREAAPELDENTQRVWEEGLFAERVALLMALRRRDPAAGLTLLASGWRAERAEDRMMFMDALRERLCPGDEPFLERALADRSSTVRATAAQLLSALPESALAARMAGRARAHLRVTGAAPGAPPAATTAEAPKTPEPPSAPARPERERGGATGERDPQARRDGDAAGDGPWIVVDAPTACDAEAQRDGVVPKPPKGRGERSWWLGQLVAAAPLGIWSEHLGGRTPVEIAALPVADGWQRDVHAAWCRAAVRQRDAEWARALIGPPTTPFTDGPGDPAKLLTVLPTAERSEWAARFIEAHGLSEAFRILGVCAVPWSAPLGRAVVDALEIARDAGSHPWSFSGVMGLAERCLDPAGAERLAPLAALTDTRRGAPGADTYWAEAFHRLMSTLRLRAVMLAELDGAAELDDTAATPGDRPEAGGGA
ncbi:DUF5691 domain-containing protein [Streptomyces sp. AJS327]|uniref:DUF5691 domain-containing protein n=1 Tax=Streptomyces sp. AJS327 TaxID=2545265 RepID=UPI001C60AAE3|nr:DUF5691 domain-containing protein [Streptomyces sp. AJS327]